MSIKSNQTRRAAMQELLERLSEDPCPLADHEFTARQFCDHAKWEYRWGQTVLNRAEAAGWVASEWRTGRELERKRVYWLCESDSE